MTATARRPRRRWGQNFLVNRGALEAIVRLFRPDPDDIVLEIGPGRGALTRLVAGRVARLVAVEIDPDLAADLERDLSGGAERELGGGVERDVGGGAERNFGGGAERVRIVRGDVLELDLDALLREAGASAARPARVFANLPYNIAAAVLLRLIRHRGLLSDLLVMVQREVAARIVSPPGRKTYGGLSVLCQAHARVSSVLRLRPGSFRPVPKVDSEMIRMTFLPGNESPDTEGLDRLLRAAFASRRKTLLNNLARLDGAGGGAAGRWIRAAGLDPGMRPEQVPVAGYLALLGLRRTIIGA